MCGNDSASCGPVSSAWLASGRTSSRQGTAVRKRAASTAPPEAEARELAAWQELVPHLPEGARLLWSALGDVRQFRRVLAEYGGRTLRIPAAVPKPAHPLRRRLGVQCLARLVAALGGTELYVPSCRGLLGRLRQQEIIRAFSHASARGQSSVATVAALAGRYGLSDRRIWQILKTSPRVPKGAEALRHLPEAAGA